MDFFILQWIQEHCRFPIMDQIMVWISATGELGLIWFGIAFLFLFLPCCRDLRRIGLTIIVALALGGLTCNLLLKPLVGRPRPFLRRPELYPFLVAYPSEYSFPSGHAVSSWGAASVFRNKSFPWRWLIYSYALLMSFSRLYLVVHYPTDIIFGFLLGLGNASVADYLVSFLEKKSSMVRGFLAKD